MPKLTYEEWKAGLSPAEEEARLASELLGDQEMLADIYRRVDPSVNPGGEYGLLPAIGQSRDGGARYKGINVDVGDSYVTGQFGSYLREKNPVDEEGYVYSERQGFPFSSQLLMEQGMDPMKPGEIYFQQFSKDVQPFKNTSREQIENPADTLIHEFFHRAVDAPWFDEFADWAENEASGSWGTTMPSTREAARTIRSLASSIEKEQSFANTLDDTARGEAETNQYSTDVANQKKLVSMDKALRAFFTPERQEKYGLRLPLKATVPEEENTGLFDIFTTLPAMLLEKVPEALGFDKTGEGPVVVPEEFYEFAGPTMANGGDPSLGSSYMLPDPVYLANGGTGTNIMDNAAFTPTVKTTVPFLAWRNQGYFEDIGGISKAQAYAMNKVIEDALAELEEQDPSKWTQAQIDAFNVGIEDNILAAASADPDNAALQDIASDIEYNRKIDAIIAEDEEKWKTWNDFLDKYERSDDLNADIQDAAEKAIEIFGYGTDAGKEAFLLAAAKAGLSTAQIAEATGTTGSSIVANLPDFNPIAYAKEAITGIWEWVKDAQGKCLVGLDGSLNCTWEHGSGPPMGGTTSGAPVWKVPGTNTTVGVDVGILGNIILGRLTCQFHSGNCPKLEDIPEIILWDIIAEIERQVKGKISDAVKAEIEKEVMSVLALNEKDSSFGLGLNLEKLCYNDDDSIHSQVLVGQSCPMGTSETPPTKQPPNEPCKDANGNTRKDADGNDLYPDINGVCPKDTTTTTDVVCYVDDATDGRTVPALADGTCPMGSSPTDPRTLETGETAESRCTTSGGTYENGVCNCGDDPTIELVDGQCMVKDGSSSRTPEEVCVTNRDGTATGNTWENGQCVGPAAGTPPPTDQEKCEANGNTWTTLEDGTQTCVTGGRVINDDDEEKTCDIKGGNFYWNRSNQTCVNRCPGGGLYDAEKNLCETTVGDDPDDPEYTTCVGITDYNQPAVNGVFPSVTQNYLAAEFKEMGGVCPTEFGTKPKKKKGPKDPDYTTCSGITDYNQPAVNGLFPTVTQHYLAAEFKEMGGVCPAYFGSKPSGTVKDDPQECEQWSWDTKQLEKVPRDENGECPTGYGGTPPADWSGIPCDIANSQPTKDGGCECEPGFSPTVTADGTLTACTKNDISLNCPSNGYEHNGVCVCSGGYAPTYSDDNTLIACTKIDPGCPTNGEINELGECACKEGFTPGYTEGVLTSCTKTGGGGTCPPKATKVNGVCQCGSEYDPVYDGDGKLISCKPKGGGEGDECPANSTRNADGGCDCDDNYTASVDGDGVMTCVPDFPAANCSNPAWAATHVAECGSCEDKEYAEANPQICGITDGDPYTRPYATFEGVDMVRPPWVTPEDVRIDRYPATEPSTYSTLPAPAGSYEYGISSLARRPQDIREAVSVIDPGYEQIQAGGPPVFTMEEVSPEEEASRRAARDRYYGAMNRLSDYSTDFNVGADELSEALGVPRTNFNEAPADGGFNIHGGNFNYATPTYGTPPEGYPTSPDILAAADRPFSSPWLEEEEEEIGIFAYGGEVAEEPQGLESLLQRRQSAVNTMLVKRGRGNGVQ